MMDISGAWVDPEGLPGSAAAGGDAAEKRENARRVLAREPDSLASTVADATVMLARLAHGGAILEHIAQRLHVPRSECATEDALRCAVLRSLSTRLDALRQASEPRVRFDKDSESRPEHAADKDDLPPLEEDN